MKTGSPDPTIISQPTSRWPLERVLFAMAGTVVLLSALLAALVSPWFLLLTAFVGLSQWAYVATRACPASLLLQRFGVEAQCEW
jgi:hypothetical protein